MLSVQTPSKKTHKTILEMHEKNTQKKLPVRNRPTPGTADSLLETETRIEMKKIMKMNENLHFFIFYLKKKTKKKKNTKPSRCPHHPPKKTLNPLWASTARLTSQFPVTTPMCSDAWESTTATPRQWRDASMRLPSPGEGGGTRLGAGVGWF